MLTQSQMADEMKLSRSVISDNVKAGAPLTSVGAFRDWRRCNVREKWNQRAYDATRAEERIIAPEPEISPDDAELCRKLTEDEFAVLVKSEFLRFQREILERKGETLPVTICPSLMVSVWAVIGAVKAGASPEVALHLIATMTEAIRRGEGDLLFKDISDKPNAALCKGVHDFLLQSNPEEIAK